MAHVCLSATDVTETFFKTQGEPDGYQENDKDLGSENQSSCDSETKEEAILISEQSRMSREDIFDAMMHWKLLRDAGVRIVTCQRGELDFNNLGGVITAIVDQYSVREESIKLAQRVVSGQRMKAMNGQRIGVARTFSTR